MTWRRIVWYLCAVIWKETAVFIFRIEGAEYPVTSVTFSLLQVVGNWICIHFFSDYNIGEAVGGEVIQLGQIPFWQATSSTASQEIPRLLWNQKLHCHFLKRPSLFTVRSQMNSDHALPSYFLSILFSIIFQFTRVSVLQGCIPNPLYIYIYIYIYIFSPTRTTCPAHHTLLDYVTGIVSGKGQS